MQNFPINCGFLVVGEYLQMNLKIDIFTSDPISSQQAANISNKEGMDVSTTESVQEEITHTNSSTNPSLGEPAKSSDGLVPKVVQQKVNLDNLSSVVEAAQLPMDQEMAKYLQN